MRASLAIALSAVALAAAGCGGADDTGSTGGTAAPERVESCVDRLVSGQTGGGAAQLRDYARGTYCSLFERNGWVYDDGALEIAAQEWLDAGRACASGSSTQPTQTVPCDEERGGTTRILDCALLHHVRRSEVEAYLERLRRDGQVRCDDGTPLADLGVP